MYEMYGCRCKLQASILFLTSLCVCAHVCMYAMCGCRHSLQASILFYHPHLCLCVCMHAQSTCRYGHMRTSDDNFWELVLFFHCGIQGLNSSIRLWGGFLPAKPSRCLLPLYYHTVLFPSQLLYPSQSLSPGD